MPRSRWVDLANIQQFTAVNLLLDPGHIGGPKIIPSTAEVVLIWTLGDGKTALNVMYGRYSGTFPGSVANANAVMSALAPNVDFTALLAHLAPTASFSGVKIRDLNTSGNPYIQSTNSAIAGTSTGTELPDETAVVVTLRTARTGPGGRGRAYIPGWATTALGAGNVVAPAAVTALQTWVSNRWGGAFAAGSYTQVLGLPARNAYTGATGTLHPARPAGTLDITARSVRNNTWDSQRRRGLK